MVPLFFNSFSKRQNFRLVQIERTRRRQNKCDRKIEISFEKGKIVGKGENAGLLFPQCKRILFQRC